MASSLTRDDLGAPARVFFSRQTLNFWKWTVLGAPLWWVLGLNLVIYQLFALALFIRIVFFAHRHDRGIFLPSSCFFIFLLAAVYLFSILIHASAFPSSRVIASFYNLSYWLMGFFLVVVMANSFSILRHLFFLNTFYQMAWVLGIMGVGASLAALIGGQPIAIPTPLSGLIRYFQNADLFMQSVTIQPLIEDWFASRFQLRFNAFSPYPTATGGLLMITMMMILTFAVIRKRTKSPFFILLFSLNVFALFMTLSRMSILVFGLSISAVFLLQRKKAPLWLALLLGAAIFLGPWILKTTDTIWRLRAESSETRLALYRYSLQELQGIDWILGIGIKNRDEAFIFPIGSHSTYVSLCVKTGLTGLAIFLFLQASLIVRWFRLRVWAVQSRKTFYFWRGIGWVLVAMMIWTMTEDIDAPQLVSFLYFSLIGVFEGMRREALLR